MEKFGFIAPIQDAFHDYDISEALANCALWFFLPEKPQTAYRNVVHPVTQKPMHSPPSWSLFVRTFLSRFLTEDIRQEEYPTVMNTKIKTEETKIAFAKRLH